MDNKDLKKIFKKYLNIHFYFSESSIVFMWGTNDNIVPRDKLYIGRRGAPRPEITLTPYDIDRLEYTKPGLFKKGVLSIIGTNGSTIFSAYFKDKANMKNADKFNECLALYKQYNLGK